MVCEFVYHKQNYMKNNILKYRLGAAFWLMLTLLAPAGPLDSPSDDDPVDPVPIDSWVIILGVAGIITGTYWLVKQYRKDELSKHLP